jgi:predicted RNA-binding Zn-ribbon protein involved in translation (DUF1610 family)
MSRPIDADALIEFIDNRYHITWEDGYEGGIKDACVDIIKEINKMPTIKRKTGKWIQFPNHMAYKCSECGRVIQTTDGQRNVSKHYPFCHCGADMRKDGD